MITLVVILELIYIVLLIALYKNYKNRSYKHDTLLDSLFEVGYFTFHYVISLTFANLIMLGFLIYKFLP